MSTQPNDAAHPIADNVLTWDKGITKREYFAAMAMQGILANPNNRFHADSDALAAEWSVKMADKLISKLNQTK